MCCVFTSVLPQLCQHDIIALLGSYWKLDEVVIWLKPRDKCGLDLFSGGPILEP